MNAQEKFGSDLKQVASILLGLTAKANQNDVLMAQMIQEIQSVLATARLVVVPRDEMRERALALTDYPPYEEFPINWAENLYDSEGYRHTLVHLGAIQVVTKVSFACAWDRRTGRAVGPGQDMSISNTPMTQQEQGKRKAKALEILTKQASEGGRELATRIQDRDRPRG